MRTDGDLDATGKATTRMRVVLDEAEPGVDLTRAGLPIDAQLAAELPMLAGHPQLPSVVHLLCGDADSAVPESITTTEQQAVLAALCQAVLATESPAIFGDCLNRLLSSPAVLTVYGGQLAIELLAQAAMPEAAASGPEILRAADALEAATQLRLGDFAQRFDLFVLLGSISGPAEIAWSRAATRALLACVEAWPEAADLLPSLDLLAGITAPISGHDGPTKPDVRQEPDHACALASAAIVQALRMQDLDSATAQLDRALRFTAPVLADDERPDVEAIAAVAAILRDLLVNGAVTDATLIARLQKAVREHEWPGSNVNHWVGTRVAASHAAWAKLTQQLERAQTRLGEPSWYQAAAVIDDIVDLYRASRSLRAFRRDTDDVAVRDIIAPMLESGFAAQAALLRHLGDHVSHLQSLADAGAATPQQLEDLPVAIELQQAVIQRARDGDASPKPSAGGGAAQLRPMSTSTDRVVDAVARRSALDHLTTGNLVADSLLEKAHTGLARSADYKDDVADAADLVTLLLVRFIHSREGLTPAARPYLFEQDVNESGLADDLHSFLIGSGRLGEVRTEVRYVGGGRVDIEFAFPGFNLYVELKVDSTATPLPDKSAYLRQSASYQTTDKRIGFLLVLKVLRPKVVAPWIGDSVDVVEVADAGGSVRHVVAFSLSGGRTAPSNM